MDIRNFFKSPPSTPKSPPSTPKSPPSTPKSPPPKAKASPASFFTKSPPITSPNKDENEDKSSNDEIPEIKVDKMDNQKGDKEDSETSRATPQSPGRSPKGKRKVHDINVNFSDAIAALTIKDAPDLGAGDFEAKFEEIAQFLLNHCIFHINEIPHRFVEVEFYYHGHNHLDTFAHCGDQQLKMGEWYFHKTGNRYRDGNYKGIDITFGDGTAHGGILIRSVAMLEAPYTLKCGPSLTVDHILSLTKQPDIPSFVEAFGVKATKNDGEDHKALYITKSGKDFKILPIVKSIRVGLSMKRYEPEREFYFGKTYRYMTQPNKVTKGKHYMVVGMHQQKTGRADIAMITGVAPKTVAKYVEAFDAGTKKDFRRYIGLQDLAVDEECTLLGACSIIPPPPAVKKSNSKKKVDKNKEITGKEKEQKEEKEEEEKGKEKEKEAQEEEMEEKENKEIQKETKQTKEEAKEEVEKKSKKEKAEGEEEEEEKKGGNNKRGTKRKEVDEGPEEKDNKKTRTDEKKEVEKGRKETRDEDDTEEDEDAIHALEQAEKEGAKEKKGEAKSDGDTEEDEEAIKLLEKAEKARKKKKNVK